MIDQAGQEPRLCACGCGRSFLPVDNTGRKAPGRLYYDESCAAKVALLRRKQGRRSASLETEQAREDVVQRVVEAASALLDKLRPLPPLPELLLAQRVEDLDLHEQAAVGLFSDYHYCLRVDPRATGGIGCYNQTIARQRLARWRDGTLRFTQMMQALMPVKVYHLFALGDELAGHGKMFPKQPFGLDETILFQIVSFVADMTQCLTDFTSRYKQIIVYKVRGNHGRVGYKQDDLPEWDNMELLAWDMIRSRCRAAGLGPDRIEFHITVSPFLVAEIMGKTFLATHGEGIRPWSPYASSGVYNAKLRTNALLGEVVNYWLLAHHHTPYSVVRELEGEIKGNGSFVGPDDLAVNKLREANLPTQSLFFVHPKYGITHPHTIHLATLEEIRNVHVIHRTPEANPAELKEEIL